MRVLNWGGEGRSHKEVYYYSCHLEDTLVEAQQMSTAVV